MVFFHNYPNVTYDTKRSICTNLKSLSQHNLSDLIHRLTDILNKDGDLPVVYWDQDSACKFNDFKHFCNVDHREQVLLFGGYHVNGSNFRRINNGP